MLHLQDIYDGIFITYSKVNQIGNFNLYALNYKMSGLKQTDKYSGTLDRTYTAEADRYDVIEGTVDMTPEELEGKSVFLWMESVESGKRGCSREPGNNRTKMGCTPCSMILLFLIPASSGLQYRRWIILWMTVMR